MSHNSEHDIFVIKYYIDPWFCSSWKKTDQDHAAIVPPALFGQKLTRKLGT